MPKHARSSSSPRRWAILWGVAGLLLFPDEALAWGPVTHVALGEAVLRSAVVLSPLLRRLLGRHPLAFLYGSVAPDISMAKNYAPAHRHCHHWHMGWSVLDAASTDATRAMAYGYLAHLAADTVAHNCFVPRQLLRSRGIAAWNHAYWEHRMDLELGARSARRTRSLVLDRSHSEANELLDEVLSPTLFSFQTNRRLFEGMVWAQGSAPLHASMTRLAVRSRRGIPRPTREAYLALSYRFILDCLVRREASVPIRLDPIGEENLERARAIRRGGVSAPSAPRAAIQDSASPLVERLFPMPTGRALPRDLAHLAFPRPSTSGNLF